MCMSWPAWKRVENALGTLTPHGMPGHPSICRHMCYYNSCGYLHSILSLTNLPQSYRWRTSQASLMRCIRRSRARDRPRHVSSQYVGPYVGTCLDTCSLSFFHVCKHVHGHVYEHVHGHVQDTCSDICIHVCGGTCVAMYAGMVIGMCIGMCIDTCYTRINHMSIDPIAPGIESPSIHLPPCMLL